MTGVPFPTGVTVAARRRARRVGIVDPSGSGWTDSAGGARRDDLVIYELHVGTFSADGSFAGVTERLPALADSGFTPSS